MADYKLLTAREMLAKGYTLASTSHPGKPSTCKECGAEIEWWRTKNGKSVPFNPSSRDDQFRVCHWDACGPAAGSGQSPAKPDASVKGLFPSSQAEAIHALKRQIVAEYKFDHEGDAQYGLAEHKLNWLYKKLVEARLALRACGAI